jgi:hypothetical protein
MSEQDSLKLAAEIVDRFSGPLREMTKSVHSFQDMLKGAHAEGSKGAKEQAERQKALNETLKSTGESLTGILTPAMAALGLSVGGAGASIGALIAKLKEAGDSFYTIQGAMRRTGMSASELDVWVRTMEKLGVPTEQARDQLSSLGDVAAQLHRNFAPQIAGFESQFTNLSGLINDMSKASGAEASEMFWKFYLSHPAPPDQQRKLLSFVHLDPKIADANADQIKKIIEEQRDFVAKNPGLDMKTIEGLHDSMDHLSDATDGFGRAMERAFGSDTIRLVDRLAGVINRFADGLGDYVDLMRGTAKPGNRYLEPPAPSSGGGAGSVNGLVEKYPWLKNFSDQNLVKLLGGAAGNVGGAGTTFNDRWSSSADSEKTLKVGVKAGVIEGLQEYNRDIHGTGTGGGNPAFSGHRRLASRLGIDDSGTSVPDTTDPSAMGSDYLIKQRAGMKKELEDNPDEKLALAALTTLEGDPGNVTESLANRMASLHHSLKSGMSPAFYGPIRAGQLPAAIARLKSDPKRLASIMKTIDDVFDRGRNVLKGATDQGMASDPNGRWRGGIARGPGIDQVYNDWGGGLGHEGNRRWRENQQAHVNAERDLLANARGAGMGGSPQKVEGDASVRVSFDNMPTGAKAYMQHGGMFKTGTVDWGTPMPASNPG